MTRRDPDSVRNAPEAPDAPAPSDVTAPPSSRRAPDGSAAADRTGRFVSTLALLAFGVWALIDTTRYSDVDSVVFPRTVGIALVTLCLVALARTWWRPSPPAPGDAVAADATWRRVLLVGSMLVAVALMSTLGFLPAALLAFAASLLAATHGRWRIATLLRHALAGLAIVLGFFALFSVGLKVPLP